jgi:hypothetical protein
MNPALCNYNNLGTFLIHVSIYKDINGARLSKKKGWCGNTQSEFYTAYSTVNTANHWSNS